MAPVLHFVNLHGSKAQSFEFMISTEICSHHTSHCEDICVIHFAILLGYSHNLHAIILFLITYRLSGSQVRLGKNGVEEVLGLGPLSEYEKEGLESLKPELKSSIEKGIKFANQS